MPTAEDTGLLAEWGQPLTAPARTLEWLYKHTVTALRQMTNLHWWYVITCAAAHDGLLEPAGDNFRCAGVRPSNDVSKLPDGQLIEKRDDGYDAGRRTACISTQARRGQGCVFCATGQMGFARNYDQGRIVEQALQFARETRSTGPIR